MTSTLNALLEQAQALLQEKATYQAKKIFKEILSIDAQQCEANFHLGLIALEQQQYGHAIDYFMMALQSRDDDSDILIHLAMAEQKLGKDNDAECHYHQVIATGQYQRECFWNLSVLYLDRGDNNNAISVLRALTTIQPKHEDAWLSLGRIYLKQKRYEQAISAFLHLLLLNPESVVAANGLGNAHMGMGNFLSATRAYQQALQYQSDDNVKHNLANALKTQQDYRAAIALYEGQAVETQENYATVFLLGECYFQLGDWQLAYQYFQHALTINRNLEALSWCCYAALYCLDWQSLSQYTPELIHALKQTNKMEPSACPALIAMLLCDDMALVASIARNQHQDTGISLPKCKQRNRQKIRLGFISPDFNNHPIGLLLNRQLALFDRNNFDIYAFDTAGKKDHYNQIIKESSDVFEDLSPLNYQEAGTQIRNHDIDILIDLSSHTSHAKSEILYQQPARFQCHFLGNVITTGHPAWQYFFTCPDEVQNHEQVFYDENLVYLPEARFALSEIETPDNAITRSDLGLPDDVFIFACFNGLQRVSQEMFHLWCDILHSSPNSVLWLQVHSNTIANKIQQTAIDYGIDSKRIITTPFEPLSERWLMPLANLVLDTDRMSAFTSTLLCLCSNTPVLCFQGNTPYNRQSAIIMRHHQQAHLICMNWDEYKTKAIQYANNPDSYHGLKPNLSHAKATSPLFDCERFIHNLEMACYKILSDNGSGNIMINTKTNE